MENLSENLVKKILISLPLNSIGRCRCVCKPWYKLLHHKFGSTKLNSDDKHENIRLLVTKPTTEDQVFIRKLKIESKSMISSEGAKKIMYPFEEKPSYQCGDDGITIVGSCNGLICASHAGDIFYVWNPCTAEYKIINSPFGFMNRCFGFGYDSKTCDYKFVSIYCPPDVDGYEDVDGYVSQVEIYTLGSDSWENYHSYNPYEISEKRGVFLNGAIHWSANLCTSMERQPQLLISMDMEDRVFKEIPQPENMDDFDYRFVNVLRGCLCLLCSVPDTTFEMWEMKDYGVRESWSKVFKIDQQELMPPMGIGSYQYIRRAVSLKDGEILLEIIANKAYHNRVDVLKIHLDELKKRQSRRAYIKAYVERLVRDRMADNNYEVLVEIMNEDEDGTQNRRGYEYMKNIHEMEAYVESLVSVNSGTFVANEQKDFYRAEEVLLESLVWLPLSLLAE